MGKEGNKRKGTEVHSWSKEDERDPDKEGDVRRMMKNDAGLDFGTTCASGGTPLASVNQNTKERWRGGHEGKGKKSECEKSGKKAKARKIARLHLRRLCSPALPILYIAPAGYLSQIIWKIQKNIHAFPPLFAYYTHIIAEFAHLLHLPGHTPLRFGCHTPPCDDEIVPVACGATPP